MDGRISDLLMVEWMQRQVDRRMDGLMNGRKGRLTKEQSVRLTTIVNWRRIIILAGMTGNITIGTDGDRTCVYYVAAFDEGKEIFQLYMSVDMVQPPDLVCTILTVKKIIINFK